MHPVDLLLADRFPTQVTLLDDAVHQENQTRAREEQHDDQRKVPPNALRECQAAGLNRRTSRTNTNGTYLRKKDMLLQLL